MSTQQRIFELGPDYEPTVAEMLAAVADYEYARAQLPPSKAEQTLDSGVEFVQRNGAKLVVAGALLGSSSSPLLAGSQSSAKRPAAHASNTETIKVANGETLSKIAVEYSTTVPAIMAANHGKIVNPNQITSGETLVIPKASTVPIESATSTGTASPNTVNVTSTGPQNIVIFGDSLTVGMGASLETDLQAGGDKVIFGEATVGDGIDDATPKAEAAAPEVSQASTALIELGTNECELYLKDPKCDPVTEVESQIQNMVGVLRKANPNIHIDWVNVFSTKGPQYQSINAAINTESTPLNYRVINWAQQAATEPSSSFDSELGVHQTSEAGYANEAQFVASSMPPAPKPAEAAPTTTTTTAPPVTAPAPANAAVSGDIKVVINNELEAYGLSPEGSAGVLGNMEAESGIQPERLENTASGVVTPYSSLSNYQLNNPNIGYGLVQWTPAGPKLGVFAQERGEDPDDPTTQVECFESELAGTPLLRSLESTQISPEEAAADVEEYYERPASLSDAPTREQFARENFNELNPPAPAPAPSIAPTTVPAPTTTTTTAPESTPATTTQARPTGRPSQPTGQPRSYGKFKKKGASQNSQN